MYLFITAACTAIAGLFVSALFKSIDDQGLNDDISFAGDQNQTTS
jgi:hypothetical protein